MQAEIELIEGIEANRVAACVAVGMVDIGRLKIGLVTFMKTGFCSTTMS